MSIIITILTALVVVEFVYIFYLETLQTTSKATSRVFYMSVETLKNANITTLFKNQGVYNLMIALGLVFGLIVGSREVVGFLLFNIIVVAVYGGLTSQLSIIWKQGGLAIITFILLLILKSTFHLLELLVNFINNSFFILLFGFQSDII